jgi:2-octaprenyl-3-methyl-6-methoxy-1,4-benzoquinol hydroxylase/2-octaprenylphenol hydroxylase
MSPRRVEVAVVGGGAVGAATALALDQAGVAVALVEGLHPAPFDPDRVDARVYALSPASLALLARLGVRDALAALRASRYTRMQVWQDQPERGLGFDAGLIGERELGWIVEDAALRQVLWDALGRSRVDVRVPARVERFEPGANDVRIALDGGAPIRASLVVAADGADSPLRALAGLAVDPVPYGESGVVAHVRTTRPHESTAWQRFTPEGPLAFLPLADGRSSIVWSVRDALARELLRLPDDAFAARVGDAFQHRLGEVAVDGERLAVPLRLQLARRWVGPRIALAGDAAHAVHPLAGQGLNLGLLDVGALVATLVEAREGRADLGAPDTLRAYERWRQGDVAIAARAFDLIAGLFRSDVPGLTWLRATGLALVDRLAPVKREFAWHAAGFAGRVPPLCARLATP